VNDSLDGFLYIDDLLDQVSAFAELPINERVDHEYEDDDAIAYRILGTPAGVTAHFLVGMAPIERDGKEYRYLQLEIGLDTDSPSEFYRDALREGPRIHLTIDRDRDGNMGAFALITERRIALKDSRRAGIDAYQGRFTSGAGSAGAGGRRRPTTEAEMREEDLAAELHSHRVQRDLQ
jgi:hypothetical protein